MNFINDPIKAKRVFIIFLVLSIIFFMASAILGYLYYKERKDLKAANSDKQNLTNQINDLKKTSANLDSIAKENTTLKSSNASLDKENQSYKSKISNANAYNDFFKYLNSVITAHGGFSGWTDAEFQQAKSLAEKTGDATFVSDVNWAWYEISVPQMDRALKIWNDIASGIENSLK